MFVGLLLDHARARPKVPARFLGRPYYDRRRAGNGSAACRRSVVAVSPNSDRIQVLSPRRIRRTTRRDAGSSLSLGVQTTHLSVRGPSGGARREGVVALRFIVEKSQLRHSIVAFTAGASDMLEALLILIVMLAAAAFRALGEPLRISFGRFLDCRRSQAGTTLSGQLAVLLGCVLSGRRPAFVAALARPAPAVAPQAVLQRAWYGSPPGRPHGVGPRVFPDASHCLGGGRLRD